MLSSLFLINSYSCASSRWPISGASGATCMSPCYIIQVTLSFCIHVVTNTNDKNASVSSCFCHFSIFLLHSYSPHRKCFKWLSVTHLLTLLHQWHYILHGIYPHSTPILTYLLRDTKHSSLQRYPKELFFFSILRGEQTKFTTDRCITLPTFLGSICIISIFKTNCWLYTT